MNCDDALNQLEAVRPHSQDTRDAELADARNHLDSCPQCRELFHQRQRQDERIGRVMRSVPVPQGLRERLLEGLFAAEEPTSDTTAEAAGEFTAAHPASPEDEQHRAGPAGAAPVENPAVTSHRHPRRRWKWLRALVAISTAAAAIVALLVLWPDPQPADSQLTLDDVRRNATLDLPGLDPFDGSFPARKPGGPWQFGDRIRLSSAAKGDLKGPDGRHRAALYEFRVRSETGREFRGVLLVMPRRLLADPPPETYDIREERPENYAFRSSGNYHTFTWSDTSEGLVYVCFLRTGAGRRKALQDALSPQPA